MKGSEITRIFAQVNRNLGYTDYANVLEDSATISEADEIKDEEES